MTGTAANQPAEAQDTTAWSHLPEFLAEIRDKVPAVGSVFASPVSLEDRALSLEADVDPAIGDPLERPEQIQNLTLPTILALVSAVNLKRRVPKLAPGSQRQLKRSGLVDSRRNLTDEGVTVARVAIEWLHNNSDAQEYVADVQQSATSFLQSVGDGTKQLSADS